MNNGDELKLNPLINQSPKSGSVNNDAELTILFLN
jgi:hypothetical protein